MKLLARYNGCFFFLNLSNLGHCPIWVALLDLELAMRCSKQIYKFNLIYISGLSIPAPNLCQTCYIQMNKDADIHHYAMPY